MVMLNAFFKRIFRQERASGFQRDRGTPKPANLDLNLHGFVIDRSAADGNPFAALDTKYTRILTSISPTLWPTTKQILGFALCSQDGLFKSSSLMAASIIFGLEQSAIYSSLHELRSVLKIPPKRTYLSGISFRDASFIEYLRDSTRSTDFYIDVDESCDDLVRCLSQLLLEKSWNDNWIRITLNLSGENKLEFFSMLKLDAERALRYSITGELKMRRGRGPFVSQEDRSECLDFLSQVNTIDFLGNSSLWLFDFTRWLIRLWSRFPEELRDRGIVNVIHLRDLRVDHLGREYGVTLFGSAPRHFDMVATQRRFRGWLETGQYYSPKTKVFIVGSTPEKRSAIFCHASGEQYDYCHMAYPY